MESINYKAARYKEHAVDLIAYAFIALFIYTAYSKIITFESFNYVLGQSPLLENFSHTIAWLIPAVEINISILLIVPLTRRFGLYAALVLMILFTTYLIYMVLSGSKLPCSCGGVISIMSWQQHIWFNIGFIFLALTGIIYFKE